ncbi:lipopolysaccharide heptosyltransferase II [Psychromonas ossibalaenae]|uniref:lipopolysaccharide heptosyltransferase II n=1 Tax=Psychromonas ossibalaenae TaxID=444922 RepID=UPI000362076C|nr:lipopolysaccharide heptosyltransferase II [Psychromonas ossibalaenae]
MKILIISPSWVGDMVMTQSLYITLKEQYPECSIDALAPKWCLPILEKMPQINQAIEMPLGHGDLDFKVRYQLGKSLRNKSYDIAYILPNSAKSALIPFFAKIPKRIGWKGEMRYGLLNDLRNNKKSFQYMVERYVSLAFPKDKMTGSGCLGDIHSLPKPKLAINEQIRNSILGKFNLSLAPKIIGLCPGAEFGPAKRWPEEHYGTIAQELIKQGYQVWLFGSVKDRATTDKIAYLVNDADQHKVVNLAGNTTLNEAVDLLSCCHTVVSNDSGLMHVAAAVGCNIVGIYGSSSPQYTPPLSNHVEIVHTDIECRPCFKKECPYQHLKCLKDLKPNTVMDCIQNFIKTEEK